MKKIMSIILGGFLLVTSLNASMYDKTTTQVTLEYELEKALNDAISNDKRVKDIVVRFKSKKEFLEASKKILQKWERAIDKNL